MKTGDSSDARFGRGGGPGAVLLTGGSGYVGKLIAAALLRHETAQIVLPIRPTRNADDVLAAIAEELAAEGHPLDEADARRIRIVPLSSFERLDELDSVVASTGVREVIHCAACLDYFNTGELERTNVAYTGLLLARSRTWGIERFVYISTAFSSGYTDATIGEGLHPEPERDPTEYTRTKRAAERLVAEAGIPFLCLRPAIIIGDSRDGHYTGKQYGLYQLWSGIERLLCSEWEPEYHVVASRRPIHLVHQDAFQEAFLAARRVLPENAFLNMVSATDPSPTGRELWNLWMDHCFHPNAVHYYDRADDVPVRSVPRRQRALVALASVNLEIGSHPWRFDTSNLDALCARGLDFRPATLDSVMRCQRSFMRSSHRVQTFMNELRPGLDETRPLPRGGDGRSAPFEQVVGVRAGPGDGRGRMRAQ